MRVQGRHNLFGKIIEITTGQRFTDFAQRELMDPLGIPRDHWIWAQDANGNTAVNGGMLLRPEDLTRLGQLMVQRGRWRDRQLISADYIAEAGTGTAANGGYGFLMWSNSGDTYKMAHLPDPKVFAHPAFPGAPRDLFAFEGALGQFNVVIPSLDMVIVRMGIPWTIDPASPQTPFAAEINPDNKEFIRRVAAAVTDVEPQPYDDPYRYGDSAGPLLRDLADIQVMLDPVGLASVLTGLGPYAIPHCNLLSCYGNLLPVNLFRQTLDLLQQLAAALAAAMR